MTTSPDLFVKVISTIYRGEDEENTIKEVSAQDKFMAEQAYYLLKNTMTVPGTKDDGTIDYVALKEWVQKSRELAKTAKRTMLCDQHIGELLSYSPQGPDGTWPCVEVCRIVEEIQSKHLETGFIIGKTNQRGVVTRGKGGGQEWALSKGFKESADKLRINWPRTANLLDIISKDYENEAKAWDAEAKREEFDDL
jgi:hypothetical protein